MAEPFADAERFHFGKTTISMSREKILFVTGRLAAPALQDVVAPLAAQQGFDYEIAVVGITVAALMQSAWLARKLTVPTGVSRVILPGWCGGPIEPLVERFGVPFELGPRDLFDLPQHFGRARHPLPEFTDYSIEILAEINHAPQLSLDELRRQADHYRQSGADVIDLGCIPHESWTGVGSAVRALRADGHRVSIDSFDRCEVTAAVEAGAELVLSCNHTNVDWAVEIPAELVAIPDDPADLASLDRLAALLQQAGRRCRLDPILEPIGYGFAASLARYQEVRRARPDAAIMMGVGNVTELTEVDSAGVNFLLAAFCEELRIGSILTTEVINWGRTAVREFDLARRFVRQAIVNRVLPKHWGGELVLLRDPKLRELGEENLRTLAGQITDPNYRIFAERGEIYLLNRDGCWHGGDPYEVFDRMLAETGPLTAEHAFYLGMELQKARTALTLGKQYIQDEALRWGFLTTEEISAVQRRKRHAADAEISDSPAPQEPTPRCPPARS